MIKIQDLENLLYYSSCAQQENRKIYIVGNGNMGQKIAHFLANNNIAYFKFVDKKLISDNVIAYEQCSDENGLYIISSIIYSNDMVNCLKKVLKEDGNIIVIDKCMRDILLGEKEVWGNQALEFLMEKYDFNTVLDVGCGEGLHCNYFVEKGKNVTAIDYGESPYFRRRKNNKDVELIIADFNLYKSEKSYDVVWCCQVLEHQLNPHDFLKKLHGFVKENGILAITVPPRDDRIVGGHVSLWNAGMLLYHLVLAGFDCKDAHIKKYGNNISIIVKKKTISVIDKLCYDSGDIKTIKQYLPYGIEYIETEDDVHFDGDIECVNWK